MTVAYAAVGASLGVIALYAGTIHAIHAVIDFHDQHTDRPSAAPIRPHRQPVAAITARPHYEACDELGPWNPSKHQTLPALLFASVPAVNGVNGGAQ